MTNSELKADIERTLKYLERDRCGPRETRIRDLEKEMTTMKQTIVDLRISHAKTQILVGIFQAILTAIIVTICVQYVRTSDAKFPARVAPAAKPGERKP